MTAAIRLMPEPGLEPSLETAAKKFRTRLTNGLPRRSGPGVTARRLGDSSNHTLHRRKVCSMKILRLFGAMTALTLASPAQAQAPVPAPAAVHILGPGDKAPDFTLLSNDWKEVKLSDFHGKKNVVVVFYVLAFTDT